jgi:hypothetical protein
MGNIEKKRLNGVLKFLNIRLYDLSDERRREIAWNLGLFSGLLFGDMSSDIIEDDLVCSPEGNPGQEGLLTELVDNLDHIQAYLKVVLDSLLQEYRKGERFFDEHRASYFPVGLDLFKLFEIECPVTVTVRVLTKSKLSAFLNENGRPELIYSFPEGEEFREAPTGVEILPSRRVKGMLFLFLDLFRGIRLSEMRQCKECSSWFVPLTARKAKYCDHNCSSRHVMRTTRAKLKANDPAAFLDHKAKERARSQKSYYGKFEKGGQKIKKPAQRQKKEEEGI